MKQIKFALALTALVLTSTQTQAEIVSHTFVNGEVFCLVSSIDQENNGLLKKRYFEGIQPITERVGFNFMGNFEIIDQIAGNHKAPMFSFVKIRSTQDKIDANTKYLPEWQHIRATRPKVWKELVLREHEITQDITMTFDSEKYYVIENIWLHKDAKDSYLDFVKTQRQKLKKKGGKVVFEDNKPFRYESIGIETAPHKLIITEWNSKKHYQQYAIEYGSNTFSGLAAYNSWSAKPQV